MEILCFFLFVAPVTLGLQYDGLRVKFGWSDALQDKDYFYSIPRTIKQAEESGWRRTQRPEGLMMDQLKIYCPPGRGVCPLYDPSGFIAGLQIALPVEEFETRAFKPEKKLVKWRAPGDDGDAPRQYWTLTQYFVSEESVERGVGPQPYYGKTLQDGAVWLGVRDEKKGLLRIPIHEAELNQTDFKKQNCVPRMGTHYYYNMTPSLDCDDILPWFLLTCGSDLVGTGFQVFGKLAMSKHRNWFERSTYPVMEAQFAVPYGPQCLYKLASTEGFISIHIYYVDTPWKILCQDKDHAKMPDIMSRVMMNGARYASQITDEFKLLLGL